VHSAAQHETNLACSNVMALLAWLNSDPDAISMMHQAVTTVIVRRIVRQNVSADSSA